MGDGCKSTILWVPKFSWDNDWFEVKSWRFENIWSLTAHLVISAFYLLPYHRNHRLFYPPLDHELRAPISSQAMKAVIKKPNEHNSKPMFDNELIMIHRFWDSYWLPIVEIESQMFQASRNGQVTCLRLRLCQTKRLYCNVIFPEISNTLW